MKSGLPYNVMRHRDWDVAPRDPVTLTALIFPSLVAGTPAFFLASTAVSIGISLVTSWALGALAPKPTFDAGQTGQLVNARDPISPFDFVYGETRKGGVITYYETTGANNKYLHQILVLAGHEVEAINDIYLNDEVVTLDNNGFVTSTPWNSKIRIKKNLGTAAQAADSDLLSESEQITSDFRGRGIAYLYIRYEYDQDVFANGLPLVTAVVRGKKVYDPRTASTAYSNNAALCVRDYIASSYGLNDTQIDDVDFAAAANICDENVTLAEGGTEDRYTINGVAQANQSHGDVLQSMMTACAGSLFWGAGKWKLKVGDYVAPVKTLTLDDLRGPINLSTRVNLQDQFNGVKGTFRDATERWIATDYPPINSTAFETEDGGEQTMLDLQLPFTTSSATAQRLAKLTLFRGREQMTLTADFGLNAFDVEVGEIIALTNERYGWTEKEFEVVGWTFGSSSEAGDLRVTLTLRETSEDAFDWNAEETDIIHNNTDLPDFNTVAAVSGLTLTATSVVNDDGATIPAIRADWTASTNAFVTQYEVQYKRLGGEEDYASIADAYTEQENFGSVADSYTDEEDYGLVSEPILTPDAEYVSTFSSSTTHVIQPVLNNYDYNVRVRAINSLGVRSPFASASLGSIGDTTPPGIPSGLSASGNYKSIMVSWANPGDPDLNYVEIWRSTTNNLSTATRVGVVSGTNFTDSNLPNNTTRFYWVRAVDNSLNASDFSSAASATTLLIEPNDFSDAVNDLFQEAGAFGIEPVSSLPSSGDFDGQLVLLLSDITIYRWDEASSSWSTDIYTGSAVETGSVTYASFAAGIEPVGVVSTLPTVSGYTGPQVVVLTTDGKLYRLVSGAWTAAVNTDDITGTIGENLFSDDLRPIERVASLPTTNLTQGRVVLLTTDNKLYRYTGTAWTTAVPATDLTGQVDGTQIADAAITATKIGNDAVTTAKIAVGAITSTELGVDAVTSAKIASSAVTAAKIGSNAVTTAKIANDAVTADVIAAGAITETKIASDAITSPKIAAGAVTASEIAADAVTADKVAANAVTASSIAAGSVTAAKISSGAVTTGKLAAGAVTANEIAADAITTDKIAANAVTAAEITSGAITTAKIAAGAVTAAEIDAGAVTTGKLAAGAVTADEIAANAVTSNKIFAGAISSDKIAANAVAADKIAANAVTAGKIAANAVEAGAIAADAVTAGTIAAGAVSADEIAANAVVSDKIFSAAITSDKISTGAIVADKLAAGSVITSKIAAGAVTANKISVSELSAISADLGTIEVDTANIANGAITNAKIGNLEVDTAKIAGFSVSVIESAVGGSGNKEIAFTNSSGAQAEIIVMAMFQDFHQAASSASAGCRVYKGASSGSTNNEIASQSRSFSAQDPGDTQSITIDGTVIAATTQNNGITRYYRSELIAKDGSELQNDLIIFARFK